MKPVKSRGGESSGKGFRAASIILSLLLFGITAFAIYELITLGIFPSQITYGLCAILAVLAVLIISMQMFLTRRRGGKIAVTILTVIVIAALGMGGFYIFKATDLFNKVTDVSDTSQYLVEVIAMKDSTLNEENDLKDKKIGILKNVARTYTDDLLNVMSADGVTVQTEEFNGILDLTAALYDKEVEAMILPAAYRGQIEDFNEDRYKNFYSDTKVVFSKTFAKKTATTTKEVENITNTPFNVLISGSDSRHGFDEVGRSDVNMIATVNPKTHVVLLTSVPRDFYVETACTPDAGCANGQLDKLTHTGLHGTETTKMTLEKLLGVEINYTMRVNFTSVINLVNALGGIDVNVAPGYAVPRFYTDERYGVTEGVNHLNGEQALAFARERYAYTEGDRQRVKNQQQVLMAVAKKALSPAIITNYPALMDALSGAFQTDLSESQIKELLQWQISSSPEWKFLTYSLDGSGSTDFCAELGQNAYVMVPDYETVATAKKRIDSVMEGKSPEEIDGSHGNADEVPNQTENRTDQPNDASSDPTVQDPGYNDPGYDDPGYTTPGYDDPGYDDPGTGGNGNGGTYVPPVEQPPVVPEPPQEPGIPTPPIDEPLPDDTFPDAPVE